MTTLVVYPVLTLCHQFDHQTFSFTVPRKLTFRGWQMLVLLRQCSPTGGSQTPRSPKQDFGGPKCDFRGWEFVCSWMQEQRFM